MSLSEKDAAGTAAAAAHAQPQPKAVPAPLDGDPALIGVPTFIVGSIALGLTLVGYVPAGTAGAPST